MGSLLEDFRECFQTLKKTPKKNHPSLLLPHILHTQTATILSEGDWLEDEADSPEIPERKVGKTKLLNDVLFPLDWPNLTHLKLPGE
jgi:hypothetical protein